MKTKFIRLFPLVSASCLLALSPALRAGETAARADAAVSEVKGDAAKAALDGIDAEIDRLDALVDNAPTAEERDAARLRLEALKSRRNELRKTYVKAR
ncbi:MAG TPA: hypothetical protein VNR00_18775, partial [Opitutus sp.]|nr:hypothetical protein [Opitutus sp.]